MTENPAKSSPLALALHEGLEHYLRERRERIPELLRGPLGIENCLRMQSRHVLRDLFCNPLNTLWAIPYLSIRKVLEMFEKFGMEFAKLLLPTIPRAARTEFQKEVERRIQLDLFGLPLDQREPSALAAAFERDERFREFYATEEWHELKKQLEKELRHLVTEYCNTQNGFNDLAASGAIVVAAQTFFGDRSLDVFMMGRRWAALWSRRKAVDHFFLGKKIGHEFYKVVHPPPPTAHQIYFATGIALAILAVFSTIVNVVGYPVQSQLGIQERQLGRLLDSAEDKILLALAKSLRHR
jgi:hypothetical protein